ncbi:ABC transporter permease [Streptomyces sp. Je 1-332]|uniref:ABC transporter permease n=1 Tax=Streptomyces sp. Je 1-332 TaxID=3231270 RepID=UPI003459340B
MAYLVLGVVVGFSVISLLNTQILATTERRREFMLQRLIGATRRQVLRMLTVEALMISLAGLLLGPLVAAATLERAVDSLRDALSSGRWAERNRDLVALDAAELGLRLPVA